MAHRSAVHIFPAVHQRKQRAEHTRLDFVRHGMAASCHVDERGPTFGDFQHEIFVYFVRSLAESGGPPHFVAFLFDEEREVQDTHPLCAQPLGYERLAAFRGTYSRHDGPLQLIVL